MTAFIDPRDDPEPAGSSESPRTTIDPEGLAELHQLCRTGRLYDIERWIRDHRPLQLAAEISVKGRRLTSALEIALDEGNHALVLLLLCNGYDPNLEPRSPLDLALRARRWDLLDLLLEWGAHPLRVNLGDLFDSYNSELWARFQALGVDLCAGHDLASTLGYHTSNKPLFGFARRQREHDPRMQKEVNIALVHHAQKGNAKGVQLCLWAGADPHAHAPDLRDSDPDENDDEGTAQEDQWLGFTAIEATCHQGDVQILERLGPDPSRDNFDKLYETASNGSIVQLLARFAAPKEVGRIISRQVFWMQGDPWFRPRSIDVLQRLFEAGGRWTTSPPDEIHHIRRALLKMPEHTFIDTMKILAAQDYCALDILHELGRTPAMRERMRKFGFFPLPPDDPRYFTQFRPTRAREVLAKFGLETPTAKGETSKTKGIGSKTKGDIQQAALRLPPCVRIGLCRHDARQIRLDRATLFERVWSQAVENLAKEWGLSGRGLSKACQRLKIPVPPRGYWAKARNGQRIRRPSLPVLQPGEAEEIVIYAPK